MAKKDYWAVIEPTDIEQGSILSVLATLKELDKLEAAGEDVFRSLALVFRGFDETPDELWEMPKVREWAHKLINRVPYLFYYIENDNYQTEQTLILCTNGFEYAHETERMGNGEHLLLINIHEDSYKAMVEELRKFAKERGKEKSMETVIAQMNQRYGQEA